MIVSKVIEELNQVESLKCLNPTTVSIFGSARLHQDSPYYALGKRLADIFSRNGYTVISGGGPGLMRAVQEGVYRERGKSIGLNIALPFEKADYDLQDESYVFEYFFTRKLAFAQASGAFLVLPGGMGTLDELFDVLTLMQTGKISRRPIALIGSQFWGGLMHWMKDVLADQKLVFKEEIDQLGIFDDATAAFEFIELQTTVLQNSESLWK